VKNVVAVILAAGESKRMGSSLSKLLHRLGEHFLVELPVKACLEAKVGRIITVVGHQANKIKEVLKNRCEYVYQEKRLGTGDALRRAVPLFNSFNGELLVLPGDAPFITGSVLEALVNYHRKKRPAATVLTAIFPDPASYGRVIRDGYQLVKKIVESKNATPQELKIKEVNSGIYCFDTQKAISALSFLKPNRVSGEIYLTDVFEFFYQQGERVEAFSAEDPRVAIGVNTLQDLERAYEFFKENK